MLALLQNSIPVDGNALGTGPCDEPFGHSTWDATHSFFVRLVCCELAAELGKVLYESPAGGALTKCAKKPLASFSGICPVAARPHSSS